MGLSWSTNQAIVDCDPNRFDFLRSLTGFLANLFDGPSRLVTKPITSPTDRSDLVSSVMVLLIVLSVFRRRPAAVHNLDEEKTPKKGRFVRESSLKSIVSIFGSVIEPQCEQRFSLRNKQKLEVELRELHKAYEALRLENIEKDNFVKNVNKRLRIEEKHRDNTKHCLDSTYARLERTKEERDRVRGENHLLRVSLTNAQKAHQEALGQLESFKKEMERTVIGYEERIKKENQETKQVAMRYQAFMKRKDKNIQDLFKQIKEKDSVIYDCKRDVVHYIARFANLVWVANAAIERMPELLKMADAATHPLNTPQEIVNFIDHCKELVWCMKRMTNP